MSFLLINTIRAGNRALRLQSFYNFCTQAPLKNFGLSSQIGRKENVKDILSIFSDRRDQFRKQHLAVACKTIGKVLFFEKDRKFLFNNENIKTLEQDVNSNLEKMSATELLDIMFLLRKQKSIGFNVVQLNTKQLFERIATHVQEDSYNLKNLISLFFSYCILNMNTFNIMNVIQKKIQLEDYDAANDLNPYVISEFFNGLSMSKYILNYSEKRLISTMLGLFYSQNQVNPIPLQQSVMILKSVSKLNITESKDVQIIEAIIQSISNNFDQISGSEMIYIVSIGQSVCHPVIQRFLNQVKEKLIANYSSKDVKFQSEHLLKSLNIMSNWNIRSKFSPQQQNQILEYFENNSNKIQTFELNRYTPKFIKSFSRDGAQVFSESVLSLLPEVYGNLLQFFSEYTDVSKTQFFKNLVKKQNTNLIDLIRIENILKNTKDLSQELRTLKNENQNKILQRISTQNMNFKVLKNLFYENKIKNNQVKAQIAKKIISLSPQQLVKNSKKSQFLFILLNIFNRKSSQLTKLIEQNQIGAKIYKSTLKQLLQFLGSSEYYLGQQFWKFANLVNIDSKLLVSCLNINFIMKSIRGIEVNNEMIKYFKNTYQNLQTINTQFVNFTLLAIELSNNHTVNKYLLDLIYNNITKLTKIERATIHKIISLTKMEGKLNFLTATKIVEQFSNSMKEMPIFIHSVLSKAEQIQKSLSKINNINLYNLEILLLNDAKQWQNHIPQVKEFVQKLQYLSPYKWRTLITSIRPNLKKHLEYRNISNALCKKFINDHLSKQNSDITHLLQLISYSSPQSINKQVRQTVIQRLEKLTDNNTINSILSLLNGSFSHNVFRALLGTQAIFPLQKVNLLWNYHIQIPATQAQTVLNLLQNQNLKSYDKSLVLRVLTLNDNVQQIRDFLQSNKQLFLSSIENKSLVRTYYQKKYLNQTSELEYVNNHNNYSTANKIKQIAQTHNVDFQLAPIVQGQKFNFRINDTYVIIENNSNFYNLPRRQKDTYVQKLSAIAQIKRKLLRLITNKKVVFIPQSLHPALIILQRQIPELNEILTEKKIEEIPEEEVEEATIQQKQVQFEPNHENENENENVK